MHVLALCGLHVWLAAHRGWRATSDGASGPGPAARLLLWVAQPGAVDLAELSLQPEVAADGGEARAAGL